jgi:hypothetical protein
MAPLKISSTNWMAGIPDRTRLFDLYIPGTHDTASGYFDRSGFTNDIGWLPASAAMTQDKRADYKTQLDNGIRYFDLRFEKEGDTAEYYQMYHGQAFLHSNLKEAISAVKTFLEANPTEVVFVSLQPNRLVKENIVTPADVRNVVFANASNSKLSNYADLQRELQMSSPGAALNLNSDPSLLWIQDHKDLDTIRQLRPFRGLGNLGSKFNLTTGDYRSTSSILDPRARVDNTLNPKLDFSGLALGDVRGKIVFVESQFFKYSAYGWDQAGSGVNPLEQQGYFSTGIVAQNNYEAPGYQEKKNDIYNFAIKNEDEYTKSAADGKGRSLPLNYTSAAPHSLSFGLRDAPATFALIINSGSDKDKYKTDGTDTLASLLNQNLLDQKADDGGLFKHNLQKKLSGSVGLKGVMLGDFYTTSHAWYNEFWDAPWWKMYDRGGKRPNVNSDDYPVSDWLTQKIWRQSAIFTPSVSPSNNVKDLLTGLPVVKEGGSVDLSWNDYAGLSKPDKLNSSLRIFDGQANWSLQYKVTQVDGVDELALASNDARQKGLSTPTLFIKDTANSGQRSFKRAGGPPQFQFNGVGTKIQKGFDYLPSSSSYLESFTVAPMPGVQGDRFFKVDLMASKDGSNWNAIGVPTYFMVADS